MRTLITIIATAVGVSALWLLTLRYRPMWIANVMFDANGFPKIKKTGDKFFINGKMFYFNGTIWVELGPNGFPINPAPIEGDTFIIDGIGYKFTNGSWVKISGPSGDEVRGGKIVLPGTLKWVCRTQGGQTLCAWKSDT